MHAYTDRHKLLLLQPFSHFRQSLATALIAALLSGTLIRWQLTPIPNINANVNNSLTGFGGALWSDV